MENVTFMILKTIPVTFTFTLENTRRKKKEITHDKADGAWGFPGGSVVKNLPAKAGDSGLIMCQEDPLEEEMATHSSTLFFFFNFTLQYCIDFAIL